MNADCLPSNALIRQTAFYGFFGLHCQNQNSD
nr:MAG TPA: hypothetical protein [Caudoviricetes sp.]